jgi:hypothetical protein
MKIELPLKLQEQGSKDCGPVCVQMVLEYFGINKDQSYLREKLTYVEAGTSAYDNASLLLNEGFKVTAVTAQPLLFSPDTIAEIKNTDDVLKIVEAKYISAEKDRPILETLKKFLLQGGDLKIEIPSYKHIQQALEESKPIIALIYGRALGSKEGGFHFIVISGYEDGKVFINNPLPESKKQGWFPIEHFLYALHSSTTADIDNGTLLVVSK